MAAVTAKSNFASSFTAIGNYAQIQACNPLNPGDNPAIFKDVAGMIYATGSLSGGALFIQILTAAGIWVSTTTTTITVTTAPTWFYLLAPSTFLPAAIGPVYGARFAITTTITGASIAYAEMTGILAQA